MHVCTNADTHARVLAPQSSRHSHTPAPQVVDLEAEEDEDARAAAALYEEDLRAQFGEEDQEAGPRMAAGGAADQLEEGGVGAGVWG